MPRGRCLLIAPISFKEGENKKEPSIIYCDKKSGAWPNIAKNRDFAANNFMKSGFTKVMKTELRILG